MRFLLIFIVMLGGCALVRPKPETLSCTAAGACPACPQCPPAKPAGEAARYVEVPFDALPGWTGAVLEPSLRAFLAGCVRQGALTRACELGRAVPPHAETAGRQ